MKIIFATLAFFILSFNADAQKVYTRDNGRKVYFPIGLFSEYKSDIYGISTGICSDVTPDDDSKKFVHSNGIRLEPISESLFFFTLFWGPDQVKYPDSIAEFKKFSTLTPNEIVNGINLSCGTNGFINVNGITVSAISQSVKNSNGISLAVIGNASFTNNGIQLAVGGTSANISHGIIASYLMTTVHQGSGMQAACWNDFADFKGLQVGLINDLNHKSESFKGLQVGVFNRTKKLQGVQLGLWNVNEKRTLPLINWEFKKQS